MPAKGARYEAKVSGLSLYFTGRACVRGHVAARRVSNGLCVECERVLHRKPEYVAKVQSWADANRAKRRESSIGWYRRNRESLLAAERQARASDPDRREKERLMRAKHRAKFAVYFREWASRNRDAVRSHARNNKAKRRAAEGRHGAEDIAELLVLQEWRCAYCYRSVEDGAYQVDHIVPLARGGTNWPSNLCIACSTCNVRKQARSADEFREILMKDKR